mgnify:CR=1 FL=1
MRFGWMLLVATAACTVGGDEESSDSGTEGASTPEGFAAAFAEAYCDAMIDCNAPADLIDAACNPEPSSTDAFEDCVFDAYYAAECVEGDFTCTSVSGIDVAEPPTVCSLVYDCPSTTDTATITGDDDDDTSVVVNNMLDDDTLAAGIQCSGSTVDFAFDFLGEASGGVLDVADSGNPAYPVNWNDFHTLVASGITSGGAYTLLSANGIATGASPSTWYVGTSTLFTCDEYFNQPDIMSYVVRAYDINGGLADCVAWGHDPTGMIAGDYFVYNSPINRTEFGGCRESTAAR